MENKKRYAVGFYNNKERHNNPEWMKQAGNRLVAYIHDEQETFNIRYKCDDEDGDRVWFVIDPKELNKAKEYFINEETDEVVELIDICNNYDKWKTSCTCCDSISINVIPYTYRDHGGCIGRAYNCPLCSGLTNRMTYKIFEQYDSNGVEGAIDLLINIIEGKYKDEEDKYYCSCCGYDLRVVGLVENGEYVLLKNVEGKIERFTIEEYNERECKYEEEIEGYYPNYYPAQAIDNPEETKGYRCFNCNNKINENVLN